MIHMVERFKTLKVYEWIIIVIALIINLFILVNAFIPAGPSTSESNWIVEPIKEVTNAIKPNTINETNIGTVSSVVRKLVGHFSLFLVSGVFTSLSLIYIRKELYEKLWLFFVFSCSFGLFLAILTEIIQLFIPGRSGEIGDVLIDFSGYLVALIIIFIILFIKKKNTRVK